MKKTIKPIVACVIFCALVLILVARMNDILVYKTYNRYYMLDKAVAQADETYDVQVFGACHSYTSFQAQYFEEKFKHSAFDLGGPGEIIPVTYLRMMERFKTDAPKVALVEIWGLNAYETYSLQENIFEYYMPVNIDQLPLSLEKLEVINDYDSLDSLTDNFHIAKYKDRLLNMELRPFDFDYSFAGLASYTSKYDEIEMGMRFANNGFCEMPYYASSSTADHYTPYMAIPDYHEKQAKVDDDERLAYEADIMNYVEKIIALCEKYDVELIFYRAPYTSTENELKKSNWFTAYCESKDITYVDLEKVIDFDINTDFLDYHHLNEAGAIKATDYLAPLILPHLQ